MQYEEFRSKLICELKGYFPEDVTLCEQKITKNNGVILDAVTIREKDSFVSPTIYINGFYDQFMASDGTTISSIAAKIHDTYMEGAQYKDININAFLDLNIPYWYIGASSVDPYSKRAFIETANYKLDFYNAERTSRMPAALKYYELFASYSLFANKPAYMAMVYSIALPIWLILFCITVMIRLDRRRFIICFLPYLFLWVTYMAGPVSNFRYIFPIYAVYPFFLFLAVFHRESV